MDYLHPDRPCGYCGHPPTTHPDHLAYSVGPTADPATAWYADPIEAALGAYVMAESHPELGWEVACEWDGGRRVFLEWADGGWWWVGTDGGRREVMRGVMADV